MKLYICFLILLFSECTQITYIHTKNELEIFKIQTRVLRVDTIWQDGKIYKVYYRDAFW